MAIKFVTPARVLPFSVLSSLYLFIIFFDIPRSKMRVNFPPFRVLGLG